MQIFSTRHYLAVRRWIIFGFVASSLLFVNGSLRGQSSASVLAYGAVPDGILRTDGAMAANSNVLTSASSAFTSADVGKYIQVIGAGPGGTFHTDGSIASGSAVLTSGSGTFAPGDAGRGIVVTGAGSGGGNLVTTIQSYNGAGSVTLSAPAAQSASGVRYYYGAMTLEGTIQSVQSSTAVTLSAPALSSISSAMFAYGTENHAAFQKALDAAGQAGGGIVTVPAPANCPSGAVCGYVTEATDQATAKAPGAVKIRYSNVSLIGDAPQTNLFCRGAYGTYTNTVAFPGVTGHLRGFCLTIGDDGGPNGAAGEAVSNVTIAKLHLYGMTNGNTSNVDFGYPPQSPSGDGWDITHKGIYMWDNSSFSNITIDSIVIQDFKAENIYSGGSPITGMTIKNSTLTNFNGNGISMLAADLQVLNNTISNGSNAAVENSTVSSGGAALIRQLYQGNTISHFSREGIVVVGVDGGVPSGTVQIIGNYFDTIAQTNRSGTESAIYVASQNNYIPPANVTVTGNTCHDCFSFGVFETSGNTLIQGNNFIVDKYGAGNVFSFTYALSGVTIENNTGSTTPQAQAAGLSVGAVYELNPGYASGAFPWKNVVVKGNNWAFPGAPQYEFVTTSGSGWNLLTADNLNWQGDVCTGCTHADVNHGMVDLSRTRVIEPFGPSVFVAGNAGPVTATVDAGKEEDGAQVQIVNTGSNPVTFASDSNLSLAAPITLPGQSNSSVNFVYRGSLGKFTLAGAAGGIAATAGTPQSVSVNGVFPTALQVTVTDANNNPVSGATVTFSAPVSGASAGFNGSITAAAVTGSNGVATAPALTANGQPGSYMVAATASGIPTSAQFRLTNNAVVGSGGQLAGSGNSFAAAVNLTAEGSLDWEHWGESTQNRKAGVTPQLSVSSLVGSGTLLTYNNDPRPVSWSDGAPTPNGGGTTNGIYINGVGQGFSLAAPADAAVRTLVLHVGGWFSGGTLTAHLSDSSAADFTDVTAAVSGQYDRNYTLTYRAGTPGQTLLVRWVMSSGIGNVTLNAAALAGSGSGSASASSGTPQSTAVGTAFAAPLQVKVLSTDGTPLGGASVSFSAPAGGPTAAFGGLSTVTGTTNGSGVATAPTLTANSQSGSYVVTATVAGITTPVYFNLTNTNTAAASTIAATAGTPQTVTVNGVFPAALQAMVRDGNNTPVSGAAVTFSAPNSGASGTFSGSSTANVPTDANGIATAPTFTANGQPGVYAVTATAAGIPGSALFRLTNSAVVASGGQLIGAGNSSAAPMNLSAEGSLDWEHWGETTQNRKAGVRPELSVSGVVGSGAVMTYNNDPRPLNWSDGAPAQNGGSNTNGIYIDGVGQGFSLSAPADSVVRTLALHVGGWFSGGTLTAHLSDSSAPDFTDTTASVSGQYDRNYTLTYRAGTAGQTLLVSWVMTSGAGNVTLNAAALAGPGLGSVNASAGTPQSTPVNTGFATALRATVLSAAGTPVSGASVTFSVPASGPAASFAGSSTATASTNSSGVAIAPALTANGQSGSYVVTASVAGVTTPAAFNLTNMVAAPASIAATGGTPQSAAVSSQFPTALQATVRDAANNPVSGAAVTFSAPASGASGTFNGASTATVATGANGIATAPNLTANSQTGAYQVTASVPGVAAPASFSLTNSGALARGTGSLTGSVTSASTAVNLTLEGTADWIHWGDGTLNRKSGVAPQISDFAIVGSGPAINYGNDPRPMSWSDGTPITSFASNTSGVYINFRTNGFTFTAPADNNTRKLTVHVGGWFSGATLRAHLSDGSAADFVDSAAPTMGPYDRNYTLTYKAAAPGQTIRISWMDTANGGNVTLNGAALQ